MVVQEEKLEKIMKININKKDILSILSFFRFLFGEISRYPNLLLRDLIKFKGSSQKAYPCEMIDLRKILVKKKITGSEFTSLFSINFADKYLKRYPIFIVINSSLLKEEEIKYGGLSLYNTENLYIEDAILRIIINKPSLFRNVNELLKDIDINIECVVSNSIPGISSSIPSLTTENLISNIKSAQYNIEEISLLPHEKEIFSFIVQTKNYFKLDTPLLVVGGWVRDKLLGKESNDIDIAISMPGYEEITNNGFVQYINKYANIINNPNVGRSYAVSLEKSADPTIRRQQEKEEKEEGSRGLKVGALDLYNQKIEFVPMRTEIYGTNTRFPIEVNSTDDPKKDSIRRDLTINTIYYNIETGKVEDYVGGAEDLLINKILKTPRENSFLTLAEDPLRALRVLRFKSGLPEFLIDNNLLEALYNPELRKLYETKVAPERAGNELMKMMKGKDPAQAVALLFQTDLYRSIFNVPEMQDIHPAGIKMEQKTDYHKYNLMNHIIKTIRNINRLMIENNESDEMRGLMNIAGLLHDFGKMKTSIQTPHPAKPGQIQYIGHEYESEKMANEILKTMAIGEDKRNFINQIISLHMKVRNADKWGKRGKAKFLRNSRIKGKEEKYKDLWKYVFYHSQADAMSQKGDYDGAKEQFALEEFKKYVEGPVGRFNIRMLVNGNDVIQKMPELGIQGGKHVGEVLNRIEEMTDTGIINVDFMSLPEGPEKNYQQQKARQEALTKIDEMVPEILAKYQENKMGNNWYMRIKISQVLSPPLQTEVSMINPEENIKRGPKPVICPYEVGMKVRDRRKGLALPQEYGKVINMDENKLTVQWYDSKNKKNKQQDFRLDDTVALSAIIAEV